MIIVNKKLNSLKVGKINKIVNKLSCSFVLRSVHVILTFPQNAELLIVW